MPEYFLQDVHWRVGNYMKEHAIRTDMRDKNQMEACEEVLRTVDHLLINNCIMSEVSDHKWNLAIACYDYQKAYDKVHHD